MSIHMRWACLVAIISLPVIVQAGPQNAAKALLDAALKKQQNIRTLSATVSSGLSATALDFKMQLLQMSGGDGVILQREERLGAGKSAQVPVQIQNRQGSWTLIGDTAYRLKYVQAFQDGIRSSLNGKLTPLDPAAFTYEVVDVSLDGTPCYKVTQRLSEEGIEKLRAAVKKAAEIMPSQFADRPNTFNERFPTVSEFFINKDLNFIICTKQYTNSGALLSMVKYENVKMDLPLESALFRIPKNYKTVDIDSPTQLADEIREAAIEN